MFAKSRSGRCKVILARNIYIYICINQHEIAYFVLQISCLWGSTLTDGLAKVAAKALHMSEPTLEELKDDKLKNDGIPLVCSISKQSYYLHLTALESKNCTRLGPAWYRSHSPNPHTNSVSDIEKLESHHLDAKKQTVGVSRSARCCQLNMTP